VNYGISCIDEETIMKSLDITMPEMRPVRIPTKGLGWAKRFITHFQTRKWEITEDYYLYVPWLDEILFIPKGFVFDGASVPRPFWPIMNPTGILLIGGLFHDFGYRYDCFLNGTGKIIHSGAGRAFFDEQIMDINIYINEIHSMNTLAWVILRVFGIFTWEKRRDQNANVVEDFGVDVVSLAVA
jgi:hypothetical protein